MRRHAEWDAFISFYGDDRVLAVELRDELRKKGFRIFVDESIRASSDFRPELEDAMRNSLSTVVLCRSQEQVRSWPEGELCLAVELRDTVGHRVIPIRLSGMSGRTLPLPLKGMQAPAAPNDDVTSVSGILEPLIPRWMTFTASSTDRPHGKAVPLNLSHEVSAHAGPATVRDLMMAYKDLEQHHFNAIGEFLGAGLPLEEAGGVLDVIAMDRGTAVLPWHLARKQGRRLSGNLTLLRTRVYGADSAPMPSRSGPAAGICKTLLPSGLGTSLDDIIEAQDFFAGSETPLSFDEAGASIPTESTRHEIVVVPLVVDGQASCVFGAGFSVPLADIPVSLDHRCSSLIVFYVMGRVTTAILHTAYHCALNGKAVLVVPGDSRFDLVEALKSIRGGTPPEVVCSRYYADEASKHDHPRDLPRMFGATSLTGEQL